jgi:hypothetical protein
VGGPGRPAAGRAARATHAAPHRRRAAAAAPRRAHARPPRPSFPTPAPPRARCALWPLGAAASELGRVSGWARLYGAGTSNLDVWLLSAAHAAALLGLLAAARAPRGPGRGLGLGGGAPAPGNLAQAELGARLASAAAELLLLAKAVAVAVLAPDGAWPPPQPPGAVGLVCMYVSISAAVLGSGVGGLLARHQLLAWEHVAARAAAKAATARGDEEAGLAAPLLGGASGGGGAKGGSGTSELGGGAEAGGAAAAARRRGTIAQLLRMSVPDTPILLTAFAAGAVAALMAALVPYYTGREPPGRGVK